MPHLLISIQNHKFISNDYGKDEFQMKRALALLMTVILAVGMSVNIAADPGGFYSSPYAKEAPDLVSFKPSNDACTAKIIITPLSKKGTLPDDLRAMLEKAYTQILNSTDVSTLNADLAKLAASKNIAGTDLAVSTLFDIHETDCVGHENHHNFDVVLSTDLLNRFVGLLHMKADGTWELLTDTEVINNGTELKFTVDSFSPFAVVVNAGNNSDHPQTNDTDNGLLPVYIAVMAVSAAALVFVIIKRKKNKV